MLDCHDIINMREVLEQMGQAGRKHLQSVLEDNQTAIDISDRRPKTSSGDGGGLRIWLINLAGDGYDGAFIQ